MPSCRTGKAAACFIVPGSLATATGGSIYDRRVILGLREAGWRVDVRELDGLLPDRSDAACAAAHATLAAIPDRSIVVIDGLMLGPLSNAIERERSRLRLVALVHLPLAVDPSIGADDRLRLVARERRALACAQRIVVTGTRGRRALLAEGLPAGRIDVIEPGTDIAPIARGSGAADLHLVCVATLNPIKGHELLIRSLHRLRHLQWRLSCVGSVTRAPRTAAAVERLVAQLALREHVAILGEGSAEEVSRLLDAADVFVLATQFETYGMAVAEALARGLPVVSTRTGAIPDLVGDAAGLLVDPGDEDALTDALGCVIGDRAVRERLRLGARCARARLAPWSATVEAFAAVLMRLDNHD
jgi:glycosyltransferase involved in cell wall biosynthesis